MSDVKEPHVTDLPWVRRLRKPTDQCNGYRWSQMPMKAIWNPVLKEKYRCKNRGHYRFKALKRVVWQPADNGDYCWSHLFVEIYHPDELIRAERWFKRHYPKTPEPRSNS